MANDVHFTIKVDGSQATTTTNNVTRQFYSLNDAINQTGKNISQINQGMQNIHKTMKRPTAYDTVGRADNAMNKFGRTIKQLRVHGIDPATNSFARFVNVVGGGMFNTVTAVITAIMGLYLALKKVNEYIKSYYAGIQAGLDTVIKISRHRIEQIKEQKKESQGIIDELQKINQKQKLNVVEQNQAVTLAERLKDGWSNVGVQIDKATGKVKNLNLVQNQLNYQETEKISKQLEQIIDNQAHKLDLMLSKYTDKSDIFKNLITLRRDPFSKESYQPYQLFRGKKIEDISIFDMFPGFVNDYDDKEAVKKIDIKKFLLGNTEDQISFLKQVAKHLTNLDAFNELNNIIEGLFQLQKYQSQLYDKNDPAKSQESKLAQMSKAANEVGKEFENLRKVTDELVGDAETTMRDAWYENASPQEKLDYLNQEKDYWQSQADKNYEDAKRLQTENKKYIDNIIRNEDGTYTTPGINYLLDRNSQAGEAYNMFKNAEKQYEDEYKGILADYDKYISSKNLHNEFLSRLRKNPFATKTKEEEDAFKFINQFEQNIDQRWEDYNNKVKSFAEAQRKKANVLANNDTDANILDEQLQLIEGAKRAAAQMSVIVNNQKEAMKNFKQYVVQIGKVSQEAAEKMAAAEKTIQDQFDELSRIVAEEAKVTNQRKGYLTGLGNNVIAKYMQDTGQGYSLRKQQIERQMMKELGLTSLNANQKSIAGRLAYIEQLQNAQQVEDKYSAFKYGVKTTNDLATKGGFNSSIYVSGKDNVAQQNLKSNKNQEKILQQINKLLPELRKQFNTLNKNLQI